MENDLEQLLNSLIEKGWRPFGRYNKLYFVEDEKYFFRKDNGIGDHFNLRQIVSKESGLWQFVCENGMIKKPDIDRGEVHNWDNPNHWLCESALKDESELENLILDNIVIKDEKNIIKD